METRGTSAIESRNNTIKSRLESNKYYLVTAPRVDQAKWFMEQLYEGMDDSNYIAVATYHTGTYEQYCMDYQTLKNKVMNFISLKDTYVSINSFWNFGRKQKNARRLNAFFIDVDYYNVKKYATWTAKQVIADMRKKGLFDAIEPSFFMDSGHGLYIFFLIENCNKDCIKIYKKIQNTFIKKFEAYNADRRAKDVSRVLRPPGVEHGETGRVSKIIYNSQEEVEYFASKEPIRRYTLDQVAKAVLPVLPHTKEEWKKIKKQNAQEQKKKNDDKKKNENKSDHKKQGGKISYLFTLKSLYFNRIHDLHTLQKLRGDDCTENCREFMCYLYRLWELHLSGGDTEEALNRVLNFNQGFTEPLSDNEVITATKSAETAYSKYTNAMVAYNKLTKKPKLKEYLWDNECNLYRNSVIIEDLNITEEEQEVLKTLISKKLKEKRDKAYIKKYYQENKKELNDKSKKQYRAKVGKDINKSKKNELEEIREKIKSLREQGFKNKEIMQKLGITSTTTYERHIKYLKQNGLL